ncbi:hypothetical protein [Spiribacter onubensis]
MVSFVIALLGAFVAIRFLRRHAVTWGLVDHPGGRKHHRRPTPVVGGLAIVCGLLAALPFYLSALLPALGGWPAVVLAGLPVLVGAGLLVFAGVLDDKHGLPSGQKLIVQCLAALAVVGWSGVALRTLGAWPDGAPITLGLWAWPVTFVAVVGYVNAFNMIDGVDGLAGSAATVMLGLIAAVALLAGADLILLAAVTVAGAVLGFLVYNLRSPFRSRASVFLGDTGSMLLGFVIVWLVIELSQRPESPVSPVGIAWILVLPVTDTLSLMTRRLLRGQNPFHADRHHLHHLLGRAGFTPGQSAMLFSGLTLLLGVMGIGAAVVGVPDVVLGGALLMVGIGHYFFVRYAWRSTQALRRLRIWVAEGEEDRLPIVDRAALTGLYGMAVAIPAGVMMLVWMAATLLGFASLIRWRTLFAELKGLAFTRIAILLGLWISFATLMRPDPAESAWLPLMWLSGVIALPLGWWLSRYRYHALPLFAVAMAALLGLWIPSVDWRMIEAGYFQTPDYWGDLRTGGLLLVIMLSVLLGGVASGIANYRRRWRARAMLVAGVIGVVTLLMLLMGLQLQSAVAAGVIGLVAMVVAGFAQDRDGRFAMSLGIGVLVTILTGSLLANTFKPAGVSLDAQYLGPVQATMLYLGGAPEMSEMRYPAVSVRMNDWVTVGGLIAERPFAGYGAPDVGLAGSRGDAAQMRSSYAALLVSGGVPALALFGALVLSWTGGMVGVLRTGVWPIAQVITAHGMLWSVLGMMLLTPVVNNPLSGLLVTAVLGLGVAASLDRRRHQTR